MAIHEPLLAVPVCILRLSLHYTNKMHHVPSDGSVVIRLREQIKRALPKQS